MSTSVGVAVQGKGQVRVAIPRVVQVDKLNNAEDDQRDVKPLQAGGGGDDCEQTNEGDNNAVLPDRREESGEPEEDGEKGDEDGEALNPAELACDADSEHHDEGQATEHDGEKRGWDHERPEGLQHRHGLNCGALCVLVFVALPVGGKAASTGTVGLSAGAVEFVAASCVAALLVPGDAGHAVAADLEVGVDASARASLVEVGSGTTWEVGEDIALDAFSQSRLDLLAACHVRQRGVATTSAVRIEVARARNVEALHSVNAAALRRAWIVNAACVAARRCGWVVARASVRGNSKGWKRGGVLARQAACGSSRAVSRGAGSRARARSGCGGYREKGSRAASFGNRGDGNIPAA